MAIPKSQEAPLDIVLRFSTSNPDLIVPIQHPEALTAFALKQQIRAKLPPPASDSRLRLIHAGKAVPDEASLGKSLHARIPPPPKAEEDGEERKSAKAKGKLPVREDKAPAARVYVHCSVGDTLTADELAAEARAAVEAAAVLASAAKPASTGTDTTDGNANTSSTIPTPRGFDRLLTTGFTAAEVAALRTQFLAIQAHNHTPDNMPASQELLALEEQWLDNGSDAANAGADDTGGFGGGGSAGIDDLLWGNIIGFFWPVGAMFWMMREEGVWSGRRQTAVLAGFVMNMTFSLFKLLS